MRRLVLFLGAVLLIGLGVAPAQAGNALEGVRWSDDGEKTRLVFELSGPVEHTLFTLDEPDRIVIDLQNVSRAAGLAGLSLDDDRIQGVRSALRGGNELRVVLDLSGPMRPRSFALAPDGGKGHRLVVDVHSQQASPSREARERRPSPAREGREVVVAIDAGHGGADPGAVGASGTYEKNVVLQIAKRLQRLVDDTPGMRAVMTRTGDYFLSLRNRVSAARDAQADFFVSIHADGFHDQRARGASVFVLSNQGASSEAARWLAQRENAADLVGGVRLKDKDDLLASVLLDLSQSATIEASSDAADRLLSEIKQVEHVHKASVGHAGFAVLTSPDVPSVLVEAGFMTNPDDERRLNSAEHQERLARAMLRGIRGYFRDQPPPGTLFAAGEHVIEQGETLSGIAHRYQVNVDELRSVNGLSGDRIRAGQVLKIPDRDT